MVQSACAESRLPSANSAKFVQTNAPPYLSNRARGPGRARRDLVRTEIANLKSRRELLESNSTRGSELERRMQSLQQPAALGAEDGDQLRRRLDKLNGLDGAVSATNGDDLLKRLEALTGKESHRPRWSTQGLDPEVAALMEQAQDEPFYCNYCCHHHTFSTPNSAPAHHHHQPRQSRPDQIP
ncbi:hypothetical protein BASA81_001340 [Batrachochytrium salamandrivorans]|nr:hypothetical protein BASA81_001340 [Batrachochytrium salamandrivorans]